MRTEMVQVEQGSLRTVGVLLSDRTAIELVADALEELSPFCDQKRKRELQRIFGVCRGVLKEHYHSGG